MSKDLVERDPAAALAAIAQDTDAVASRRAAILARGERFVWRMPAPPPEHVQVLRVALAPKQRARSPVPRVREQAAQALKPDLPLPALYAAMDRAAAKMQGHETLSAYALPSPAAILRASSQWLLLFARGQADHGGPDPTQDRALERIATLLCALLAVETGTPWSCDATRYLFPTPEHAIDWLDAALETTLDATLEDARTKQDPTRHPKQTQGYADVTRVVDLDRDTHPPSTGSAGPRPHSTATSTSSSVVPDLEDVHDVACVLYLDRVLREARDEFGRKVMRSFVDVVSHPVSGQPRLRRQQLAALLSSERTGAR